MSKSDRQTSYQTVEPEGERPERAWWRRTASSSRLPAPTARRVVERRRAEPLMIGGRSVRPHEGPDRGHRMALLVFAIGVAMVATALVRASGRSPREAVVVDLGRRVDFQNRMREHMVDVTARMDVQKLEIDRAEMERSRARVTEGMAPAAPDVVTLGVPLKTQPYHLNDAQLDRLAHRTESRNGVEAEIRGLVKDDRDAVQWEWRAQRMYVADFIRNARDAGWDVQVDENLNVVYRRLAEDDEISTSQESSRSPQSVGPAPLVEIRSPLFAPVCLRLP